MATTRTPRRPDHELFTAKAGRRRGGAALRPPVRNYRAPHPHGPRGHGGQAPRRGGG